MIKNILAHPTIRYLILCGVDLNNTSSAIINFMEKGIDENRKIIGHEAYIDSNIPLELIEMLRKNVRLIDMRGKETELSAKIAELKSTAEPFCEPVIIPDEKQKDIYDLDTGLVCPVIRSKDICEAWLKILDLIMKFGEIKKSEYTDKQKEILNLTVVLDNDDSNVDAEKLAPWMQINEQDLEIYYLSVFSPEKPADVRYSYGERLFSHPLPDGRKLDQIAVAIDKLKKNPHTRRAIGVSWNVALDTEAKEDQPCICMVSWNVKNGKLFQTAIIRSNDMFDAWPRNAFALRKLQKYVAERAGLHVGQMSITSISAHLYEHSWKTARELIEKYWTGKRLEFVQDKMSGYFIISVSDDKINVQHYLLDGRPSAYKFSGVKAQDIYRRIIHENLIHTPDHLAYLGHELARAEIALKTGSKFVQDEA